jgi:flagellar protein FliO/FliZ
VFALRAPRLACVLAATPLRAVAEAAQPIAAGPEIGAGYLLQLLLGLAVVMVTLGVLAWLMRNVTRLQSAVGGAVQVKGGVSLGPRERAVLLQVGDRQLLVGVAPGRVETLHVLERPVAVDARGPAPGETFAVRLAQAIGKRSGS